jgi:penicillin amidase
MHWKKITISVIVLILTLPGFFLLFSYLTLTRTLPTTAGVFKIDGIVDTVKIWRDEYNIPHICAKNDADLYFALGFVSAQDRLWQMDYLRKSANGRLAQIMGKEKLKCDIMARTLGFNRLAKRIVSNLPYESKHLLDVYSAGINTWLELNKDKMPVEFALLQYLPEKWRPEDSIACMRFYSFMLAAGWHPDLLVTELSHRYGYHTIKNIIQGIRSESLNKILIDTPEHELKFDIMTRWKQIWDISWVVTGKQSYSPYPLIASEKSFPFTIPTGFYLVHLFDTMNMNAAGAILPGFPGLLVGRNNHIAWSMGYAPVDNFDIFEEQLAEKDSSKYIVNNKEMDFEENTDVIHIKDASPYKLVSRTSIHGPVLNDSSLLINTNKTVSLSWTGFEKSDEFTPLIRLLYIQKRDDFVENLKSWKCPSSHFLYADVEGGIGYQLAAGIPVKTKDIQIFPLNGADQKLNGQEYLSYGQLPSYNNQDGFFISSPTWISRFGSVNTGKYYQKPNYIFKRLNTLLDSLGACNPEQFVDIQHDVYSEHAKLYLERCMPALDSAFIPRGNAERIFNLLKFWDFNLNSKSIETCFFEMFYLNFLNRIFYNQTDIPVDALTGIYAWNPHYFDSMFLDINSDWTNERSKLKQTEQFDNIVLQSFISAIDSLETLLDKNIGMWYWSRLYHLEHLHPLASNRALASVLNIEHNGIGGGNYTINKKTWLPGDPFNMVSGIVMRHVFDLSDSTQYQVILSTGQSGHFLSKHYDDQNPLFNEGKMIPVKFRLDESDKNRMKLLLLSPSVE